MMSKLGDEKNPAHLVVEIYQAKVAAFGAGVLETMYENAHAGGAHVFEAGKVNDDANLVLITVLIEPIAQLI